MGYITITMSQDDKYIAWHPELPPVLSQGETPVEARGNLIEATELAIEHLRANGLLIPEPMDIRDLTVDLKGDF